MEYALDSGVTYYLGAESGENAPCEELQVQQDVSHSHQLEPREVDCRSDSAGIIGQCADLSTNAAESYPPPESQALPTSIAPPQHTLKHQMRQSSPEISPRDVNNASPGSYSSPLPSTTDFILQSSISPLKCKLCNSQSAKQITIREDAYCLKCVLQSLNHPELIIERKESAWSTGEIVKIYESLSGMLDERTIEQLPRDIPLPIGHCICIGCKEAVTSGYPDYGHIVAKEALAVGRGCPNGHVLCKDCADKLPSCPEPNCGAFVAQQVRPSTGPALSFGEGNRYAGFYGACIAEESAEGMPPKEQPEEAKTRASQSQNKRTKKASAKQAKVELPKEKPIKGRKSEVELPKAEEMEVPFPAPAAKELMRSTRVKRTNMKRHIRANPQAKAS